MIIVVRNLILPCRNQIFLYQFSSLFKKNISIFYQLPFFLFLHLLLQYFLLPVYIELISIDFSVHIPNPRWYWRLGTGTAIEGKARAGLIITTDLKWPMGVQCLPCQHPIQRDRTRGRDFITPLTTQNVWNIYFWIFFIFNISDHDGWW